MAPFFGLTRFFGAGSLSAWVVPAILFVVFAVAAFVGVRWIRSEHLEALRAIPLFSLLSDRELSAVLGSTRAVRFPLGATVIRQGEHGKGFFAVTDGTAKVSSDDTDVATLGPGSYFGEMAVIDGGPRTATITAQTEVFALEIGPTAFRHLVDREPMIARSIYQELSRRLKAEGIAVEDDESRVDRANLVELCQRLRQTRNVDWAKVEPTSRRKLRFSRLFARGA